MENLKLVTLLLIYGIRGSSTQSLPCHTASGNNCTSSICPNTVVTYTCTITSGTAAGLTDWTLPTGTCPTNAFSDKIRLSQLVSGLCTAQVTSTCGPYTASSIQSSDPTYCLSSILTVNITAAMNGSTVTCYNTNLLNTVITTVISSATIYVVGPPGAPNVVANTISADMVLGVVNPSSSGGLPTSYSVTISNSSYVYSNSTPAFRNGSAMVAITGLTIGTNYTISAVAINCAGSSNPTIINVSWPAPTPSPAPTSSASITSPTSSATPTPPTSGSIQSLSCHTASGDNCTSSICPNTVVTYTCTITSGTPAGYTDWTLPTGTCPSNTFPDKIRLSQLVSGSCSAQGQTGISTCGPYRASSIQSSDPIYCLSSILTVNVTAAMNGSTVTCSNTNLFNTSITDVVSSASITVAGPPGHPNAMVNTTGLELVLVVVNPSSSGYLPTSYSITISNSSYGYSNSTPAFLNGSAMVTFTGLTIGTNYTISAVAINCAGSSNPTTIYISWPAPTPSPASTSSAPIPSLTSTVTPTPTTVGSTQSFPCHTASGDNCTSRICPNTVVTYTCTITSGTAAGYTDWTLPTGTCPSNTFPDKIKLSQLVSGSCSAQGQTGISTCGPYRASSIQSSNPIYCLFSILSVNITATMNGSTVTCSNTNLINTSITTVVSSATIIVVGPPGAPNAVANNTGADTVLVVVNPSSSGGLPTNYSVTISNSSYVYSNSTPAFLNGSAMVTFTGLTIGTNYTISAVAINCAGSSNPTTIYVSWPAHTPPTSSASTTSPTSSASITSSSASITSPTSSASITSSIPSVSITLPTSRASIILPTSSVFITSPTSRASITSPTSNASITSPTSRASIISTTTSASITTVPTSATTPTPHTAAAQDSNASAIGGGIGGGVGVALSLIILVLVVICYKTKGCKGLLKKKERSVELGMSMPPCAPYDGNRALYQDPNAEIYSQAPGGEVYAMADKRPKVVVEHLASPGGDLYAVADNKQPKRKYM